MLQNRPDRLETYRARYATVVDGWRPATAVYQDWVASQLRPGAHVLDLGCGRGGIVERLGDEGTWVGTDPDLSSLQDHRRPYVMRACGPSEALPFPSASFDLVVSSWVFEHLSRPGTTFAEIARVLRPGGRVIFLTPNARHPLPRLSIGLAQMEALQQRLVPVIYRREAADAFPVAYRANTAQEIIQLAVDAGLRLVRIDWIADPSYLAWETLTFWLAVGISQLLPARWKVHLVGELIKV